MTCTPFLLAFGFAHPAILTGLGLGAIPIVIHLLHRRRHREMHWAAMQFLLAAVRKNARRIRLEQLVLLVVRTLILVLAALAFARPHFDGGVLAASREANVHRILLLDASLSMGYQRGGQTRFEVARDLARRIVTSSRAGDALNLVRIAATEPRILINRPTFQHDEVLRELEAAALTEEHGDVLPSLQAVERLLGTARDIPAKELFILSDLQRANWAPDAPGQAGEIRALLRKFSEAARLVIVDVGESGSNNVAVTDLRVADGLLTTRQEVWFQAGVTAFGSSPATAQAIEFYVDGRLHEQRPIVPEAGTELRQSFSARFSAPGEHRVEMRLKGDALPADDRRSFVVPVRDQVRVLCVNGQPAGRPRDTATYHLETALAPGTRDRPSSSPLAPRVVSASELRGFDLSGYDCVFLCNVSAFEPGEVAILEAFVRSGGGVVWVLGDRIQPDNYNERLYRNGQGLLPCRIGARRGDPADRAAGFGFDPLEFQHPIVAVFQGNPDTGLSTTRTYAYYRTELPADGTARKALAFDTGDPAIVEMQVGSGRSLLVATPVDDSWGNWALWPSFVPLIQEVAAFAVRGRLEGRNLVVGEPWRLTVPSLGADVAGEVERPDGETEPLQSVGALPAAGTAPRGGATNTADLVYDRTDRSGFYTVRIAPPIARAASFSVHPDPRESNLARIEAEDLQNELLPGSRYHYQRDWRPPSRGPAVEQDAMMPAYLTKPLLMLVLYLLIVELLLAWNFAAGLLLLFPPAGAWLWWKRVRG